MDSEAKNYCNYFNFFKENKIFDGIPDEAIHKLLFYCDLKKWKCGKIILANDKSLINFYIILEGKLKVYYFNVDIDRSLTLFLLSKNDVFDIFTLISNLKHNVNYRTLEETNLLVIKNNEMQKWLEDYPNILHAFFKYSLTRFNSLETHIKEFAFDDVSTRLAKLFLQNYNIVSGRIESIDGLNHDELAQLIGTTRAVLNRRIQELKEENIIYVGHKHVEVLDLQQLIKKSQFGNYLS